MLCAGSLAHTVAVSAQISVPGSLLLERHSGQGESYGGVIPVRNSSGEPQEVRIYQHDYLPQSDGTSLYEEPGSSPRSNARWIAIGSRIVVPPGRAVDVPFNVIVPPGLPVTGTYWSIVMIEAVPPGSPESSRPAAGPQERRVGLTTRFRTGVQIVTHVGGQVHRDARFGAPGVQSFGDTSRVLHFDLHNTGELGYTPALTLQLYTEAGDHVSTLKASRGMTYPGLAIRQRFELGRLPRGRYHAIVSADLGEDTVIGARYTFSL